MQGFHFAGEHSLVRNVVIHHLLDYWVGTGRAADRQPHQALLEAHVLRRAPVRVAPATVRDALDTLVRAGVLHRIRESDRNIHYRLDQKYARPIAPGYARNVRDLLQDPVFWVDDKGKFSAIGLPRGGHPRRFDLAAFPHHFALHAWMRAWIHALNQGLGRSGRLDPVVVARMARAAPMEALWNLWQSRRQRGERGRAGRAFERTRLWRHVRHAMGKARGPARTAALDAARPGWAEEAVVVLHQLCGHGHLRVFHGNVGRGTYERVLSEQTVFLEIDGAALGAAIDEADRAPGAIWLALYQDPGGIGDDPFITMVRTIIPSPCVVERAMRAMSREALAVLWDHRPAWPGGPFAGAPPAGPPSAVPA